MSYKILLGEYAREYLETLDEKSTRIVKDNLRKLEENSYPGEGQGDKKKEIVDGEEMFRLHVGRIHTAFYIILEEEQQVRVVDIMTIDEAHKRYGF